jgi:1-acyl-sn-glycerol-3-phosphate acyltransferase
MNPWYRFCRRAASLLLWLVGGVRPRHTERIPKEGPVIFAPNHLSFLDPPCVAIASTRSLNFMAKEELFKGVFGKLIRSLDAFPVKRGTAETETFKIAVQKLQEGKCLLIFPEGTRGDGEKLGPINRGVSMFAKQTGAKVVPVGISGTEKVLGKKSKGKFSKLVVVFGEPFTYEDCCTGASEKENRELFAKRLAKEIAALTTEAGLPMKSGVED